MIKDLFAEKKQLLSFEVFPPKKEDEFANAFAVLDSLAGLQPDFISVTYGAGGSKSKKTVEIASYIQNQLHIMALAHMTCVGSKKEDIDAVTAQLKEVHVNHVLALRGDRPSYMSDEQFDSRHFSHAADLITYLKGETDLHIAGACYPEKHYEAADLESDNEAFYKFLEKSRNAGITLPVCAGIMPITSAKQLGTTVSLSGSAVPKQLADIIATYGDDPADMRKAGIDYAIRQILDLKAHHADGIHIYTMNKPKVAQEIVSAIQ